MSRFLLLGAGLFAALTSTGASAYDLGEYGKITGDFRYRYEHVDQETKPDDANASTARLRLGYQTPTYKGFSGYAEMEAIRYLGEANFNDGLNNKTNYPSVNDPRDTAVNQLYLNYVHPEGGHTVTLGRQYIVFDNQRFIGWSKFRQNDTTHDGLNILLKPIKGMTFNYAHSIAVHRSMGTKLTSGTYEGNLDMVHADYQLPYDLKLIGYGYWLDFDRNIQHLASQTYGGRVEWKPKDTKIGGITPLAVADVALQQDMGHNTDDYSELYHWLEIGGTYDGFSLSAIYERLGGNGSAAVQTPIGTVHSFNGWVDKLTTVPDNGLRDYFLWLKAPIGLPWKDQKLGFEAQLHEFDSDANDQDYGHEVNLGLVYTPVENHTITAQLGRYYAEDLSDDTTKVWLYYDFKF